MSWGGGNGASGERCNDQDASTFPGPPLSACCATGRVVRGIRVAQGSGTGWLGNFALRLAAYSVSLGNFAPRLVAYVVSLGNLAPRLLPRGCFLGNFRPRLRGAMFPSRSQVPQRAAQTGSEIPQLPPDRPGRGPSFPSSRQTVLNGVRDSPAAVSGRVRSVGACFRHIGAYERHIGETGAHVRHTRAHVRHDGAVTSLRHRDGRAPSAFCV